MIAPTPPLRWRLVRSVPRSQVWPGSRGGERGRIHLRLAGDGISSPVRIGRLNRYPGQLLCAKGPWHSETARFDDDETRCSRCQELADRYEISWPSIEDTLTDDERRVLAHITGRTRSGGFANQFYDWDAGRWDRALGYLTAVGYVIRWVHGTVADDPTVTGGYVIEQS